MKHIKVITVIMMLFVVTACASEPKDESKQADEKENQKNSLTVSLISDPVSLDPHAANDGNSLYVMNTMYDTLVELDTNLEIKPALAESLEQIKDTVWEAKLRKDVTFHDGSKFNAEVVKANLDRVRDPDIGSPLAFLFSMIESVDVVDEYTVHIKTVFPFAALPSHLAHPGGHMISLESIKKDYEAIEKGGKPFATVNEHPIGTGYFKYDDRVSGEFVKVVKNEDYWGEKAKVDEVVFKAVPEDLTRVAELKTGDSDIIYPVNANDIEEIDAYEGTLVKQTESASMSYLGMNTEKEPFNDVNVRRAIAMAIDKKALVEGVMDGVPLPAKGPLAPTVFGYHEDIQPLEHNKEEAKKLLKEAGYEDGISATVLAYDRTTADIAEFIQAQLKEVGVDLKIETAEIGAYLEFTAEGEADMYVGSWGTVTLDADYGLYPMFHSENTGSPGNRSFYANDEVDKLLEQGRKSLDPKKRKEFYQKAQQIIVDEAPIVPLYHSVLLAGLRENIDGFFQYPSSFPFLRDVTIK